MDFQNSKHLLAAVQKMRTEYLKTARTTAISVQQNATCRDDPVKGPLWVSKFSIPSPTEDTSRDLLLQLVDEANEHSVRYDRPSSAPLDFEWVGFRNQVQKDTPEPAIGENEKFLELSKETKSPLTILYVYGGSFVLNSPSSYRKTAAALSQTTGAKVLLVRQRLAPQNPFPAALLDIFQAYLTLLIPPTGSPHKPIPPSSIVIAGDSSGATLALGLLQVLLRLQRRGASITFHGAAVPAKGSIPAGISLLSPAADLSNAFPSFESNAKSDIFPVPIEKLPYLEKSFPTCSVWPTRPPRANLYCDAGMLAHPLASPAAASADDWAGMCPIWMGSGQEQTVDASRLVAREIHRAGGSVTLQEYEGMPHTFFWVFRSAPQTKKILKDWAQAIVDFGQGGKRPLSSAQFIKAKGLVAEPLQIDSLVPFTVKEAREMMYKKTAGYKVPAFHREGYVSNL
ncbi:benzoate 4-monooxygenase cytochrome P450 [Penicillium longicatenatum]|uniref:benzoate 4-monooxygenase cytochrome P450 n=1 Tax=Penicillium longicatenatum TaxID=1561947 RepID=UPI00254716F3|nr:benzoate 4-monooxygenase cytochrome P450 [Penicillium longicatenatum]KAJ5650187.1 benzoate 4-monooxygenase cytochrome P450 [Penicillium longicatenatum]